MQVEFANPIGQSKKQHKVYIGQYEILNIPPEFRSPLRTKQLLFEAHSKYVKTYGLQYVLADFIKTMKDGAKGIDLGIPNQK